LKAAAPTFFPAKPKVFQVLPQSGAENHSSKRNITNKPKSRTFHPCSVFAVMQLCRLAADRGNRLCFPQKLKKLAQEIRFIFWRCRKSIL